MTIATFRGNYRWLSNFHPCTVTLDGVAYPSVEHAYQAAKTGDPLLRARMRDGTAGDAKRLGRTVLAAPDWAARKVSVMRGLLRQKFARSDLRMKLLATGDAELVEGNWWGDTFWGIYRGVGDNVFGRLLMEIRAECVGPHRG